MNGPGRVVVVVDPSSDTREVLSAVLARRGARVMGAATPEEGMGLVRRWRPAVVVVDGDLESRPGGGRDWQGPFRAAAADQQAALVVLSDAPRSAWAEPAGRTVPKPYHYGPLVRTIEQLLAETPAAAGRGEASEQAVGAEAGRGRAAQDAPMGETAIWRRCLLSKDAIRANGSNSPTR